MMMKKRMVNRMKLTIDLPDTTTAVAVTYVYEEGGEMMLANRLLDTADIDGQREEDTPHDH